MENSPAGPESLGGEWAGNGRGMGGAGGCEPSEQPEPCEPLELSEPSEPAERSEPPKPCELSEQFELAEWAKPSERPGEVEHSERSEYPEFPKRCYSGLGNYWNRNPTKSEGSFGREIP